MTAGGAVYLGDEANVIRSSQSDAVAAIALGD
jgi:hypothetical protein